MSVEFCLIPGFQHRFKLIEAYQPGFSFATSKPFATSKALFENHLDIDMLHLYYSAMFFYKTESMF